MKQCTEFRCTVPIINLADYSHETLTAANPPTNSMEQSPCWEAKSDSSGQENHPILCFRSFRI